MPSPARKPGKPVVLSEREEQVLAGIRAGKIYSAIAFELGIGYESVKTYASRLRAKYGVRRRDELAALAS